MSRQNATDRLKFLCYTKCLRNGIIIDTRVHTTGGGVKPGEALTTIVPREQQFVVEAMVRPDDVDTIAAGQPARVTFPAAAAIRQATITPHAALAHSPSVLASFRGEASTGCRYSSPRNLMYSRRQQKI